MKSKLITGVLLAIFLVSTMSLAAAAKTTAPTSVTFSGSPTTGTTPLSVKFTATSSGGTPTEWTVNFGDGNSISSKLNTNSVIAAHVYQKVGIFTVSFKASNIGGSKTVSKSNYIVVRPVTPIANFQATYPIVFSLPYTIKFKDISSGNPTKWNWKFGDGTTSTTQNPTHTYKQYPAHDNSYIVTLTVSNSAGSSSNYMIFKISSKNAPIV